MLYFQVMSTLFLKFQRARIVTSYITYQHAIEMSVPYQFLDLTALHTVRFQAAILRSINRNSNFIRDSIGKTVRTLVFFSFSGSLL